MTDYLVTYDFKDGASNQWAEFIKQAELAGLVYVFQGTSKLFRLTNTTVWGVFADTDAVKTAFDTALAAAEKAIGKKITLEKRFITAISSWSVRSDKEKAPDSRWTKSTKFETCRAHQKNDPFFAY
ncbi:hypothetical protein [Gemmobacter sp. 24YEA27]|uniref:hypothetical protein n=1 Tax=Gemmobacter sp. 24YEA27 TaxID=3040672 RepID=UPI0024B3BBBC|nr:hypothetical protein [Gemmobacter sp. 24YEA27]